MRSLFIRLFLWFWLTVVISGGIFFIVVIKNRPFPPQHHHFTPEPRPIPPVTTDPIPSSGHQPPRHPKASGPPGFPLFVQLLIYFVVGGLVCYLLAWRLTAPIRRLRTATQRLANGDLTTRVGIGDKGKGDEISDLARDFDRMAERIELLLLSQKQLVRDISHELRSPLARLGVALGLARRTAPPEAAKSLDRIEQEASRLNEMISELLTLSLIETGSSLKEAEPVEFDKLLLEVVEDADFEAANSGRSVRLTHSCKLKLSGNQELLRRSIENVVRNAVRYTAEGSVVDVALYESSDGANAYISVRDHGSGVPDEALDSIFKPFFRIEEARDRQSGGTGLGLAITAGTIKQHGGTVKAANHTGGGLLVTITLPVAG